MKAVYVEAFGGPDALLFGDRPLPVVGPKQVRVAVEACGVCRHDVLTRAGAFPAIALPVILGHQIAGVVDAVGAEVSGIRVGDRVMSLVYETCGECAECLAGRETYCRRRPRFLGEDIDGGYADFAVADERVWVPLPPTLDFARGAVLTCSVGTAYHAIVTRAAAQAGETALLTGASGGVGMQAVGLLAALGVTTIAVTRRESTVQALLDKGAAHVVVSHDGNYRHAVKELTDVGVDFAIDIVGGDGLNESIHSLRPGGRLVVLGNVEGGTVTLRPAHLILKELTVLGTKSVSKAEMVAVLDLVARGVLDLGEVDRRPLQHAAAVHREMAVGDFTGRTVLAPGRS